MEERTVDVVLPAYGGWELTERCLASLAAQTLPHRTIVVDNASPDDTVARIRAAFPAVGVIEMGENTGFARAVNTGVAAGEGELVVVLNNDVTCEPDFIARLIEPFADARIGSATPLLLKPGGRRLDSYGIVVDATLAGFIRLQGRPLDALPEEDAAWPLLGPYGGAAAYRRSAWEEVGGMDERLFMYCEELDLALRLRAAGWRTAGVAGARGTHVGSATVGKRSRWQRERGGFGRGYLLRRYGVLRTRVALRALLTEAIVVLGDALLSRDLAALRGRVAGWRAARGLPLRPIPRQVRESAVGLRASLRLRVRDYAGGR